MSEDNKNWRFFEIFLFYTKVSKRTSSRWYYIGDDPMSQDAKNKKVLYVKFDQIIFALPDDDEGCTQISLSLCTKMAALEVTSLSRAVVWLDGVYADRKRLVLVFESEKGEKEN